MASPSEPTEAQVRFLQQQQQVYDLFYRVFTTADGQAVLKELKKQAWYTRSTFTERGERNQGLRDAREGQRNLVMLIESFVDKGRTGVRPPAAQATSNTARGGDR